MASGTIFGTANHPSGKVQVKVEWRSTANVTTNASSVVAELWVARLDGYQTYSQDGAFGLTVDGNTSNVTGRSVTLNQANGWQKVHEHTVTVPHNADGTRQVTISATGSMAVTGWTATSLSGTATLDTIPRATQPTISASSFDLGTPITISLPAASPSFTHAVRYSLGSYSTTFYDGPDRSVSYTWPLTLAAQMPDSTSLQGRLWVDTYSNGTHIGTKDLYYTARVPASVVPTAGTLTVSDASGHTAATGGVYVQGQSRASVSVGQSSGAYGSTIRSVSIAVHTTSQSGTMATFDLLTPGTIPIQATVIDSRGRAATQSATITVVAYQPPVITSFDVYRVHPDGTPFDMGDRARAIHSGTASAIPNNAVSWVFARVDGATVTNLDAGGSGLAWSHDQIYTPFDPTDSHTFRLVATDLITSTTRTITLPTGLVTMAWGKRSVGIGKVPERGTLDVGGEIWERDKPLAHLYGLGFPAYLSAPDGVILKTDIAAAEDLVWMLDIRRNTYGGTTTGYVWVQGYAWGSGAAIIQTAATSTAGACTVDAFILDGFLGFYIHVTGYAQTYITHLSSQAGSTNNRITSVTQGPRPTGTSRDVPIVATTL